MLAVSNADASARSNAAEYIGWRIQRYGPVVTNVASLRGYDCLHPLVPYRADQRATELLRDWPHQALDMPLEVYHHHDEYLRPHIDPATVRHLETCASRGRPFPPKFIPFRVMLFWSAPRPRTENPFGSPFSPGTV